MFKKLLCCCTRQEKISTRTEIHRVDPPTPKAPNSVAETHKVGIQAIKNGSTSSLSECVSDQSQSGNNTRPVKIHAASPHLGAFLVA